MEKVLESPAGSTEIDTQLGELLVREEMIAPENLQAALAIQQKEGRRLAEILRAQGTVKAEDLSAALSIVLNVPFIDLQRHKVQPAATRLIPVEFARKHTLVPLDVVGDSLW